jgi:MFS-type transporter involved in bile tolerance (Atg22 family)
LEINYLITTLLIPDLDPKRRLRCVAVVNIKSLMIEVVIIKDNVGQQEYTFVINKQHSYFSTVCFKKTHDKELASFLVSYFIYFSGVKEK